MTDADPSPLTATANAGAVALVTGGGTGIGRATALELARTGASVAICGRRGELLEEARHAIEACGAECLALPVDVREPAAVDDLLDAIDARFGRLDVLVNNAGGQFMAPAEEISLKGWRAVHRVSVDAVWDITQKAATRWMIPNRRGVIVFLGLSPRAGMPGLAHAAAARGAIDALAGALALEWSRFGIRAVNVALAHVDSEGMRANYADDLQAAWPSEVPLQRYARPEEVARVIAFLTSSGGAYITGTTVVVDGGVSAWGNGSVPPPLEQGHGHPAAPPWASRRRPTPESSASPADMT